MLNKLDLVKVLRKHKAWILNIPGVGYKAYLRGAKFK